MALVIFAVCLSVLYLPGRLWQYWQSVTCSICQPLKMIDQATATVGNTERRRWASPAENNGSFTFLQDQVSFRILVGTQVQNSLSLMAMEEENVLHRNRKMNGTGKMILNLTKTAVSSLQNEEETESPGVSHYQSCHEFFYIIHRLSDTAKNFKHHR